MRAGTRCTTTRASAAAPPVARTASGASASAGGARALCARLTRFARSASARRSVPVVVIARARVTFGVTLGPTLDPRESESSSCITPRLSRVSREILARRARASDARKFPAGIRGALATRASSNARERPSASSSIDTRTSHDSSRVTTRIHPARDAAHHSSTRASPSTSPPSSRARATERTNEFYLACPSTRLARDSFARAGRPNASSPRGTNERLDRAVSTGSTTTTTRIGSRGRLGRVVNPRCARGEDAIRTARTGTVEGSVEMMTTPRGRRVNASAAREVFERRRRRWTRNRR